MPVCHMKELMNEASAENRAVGAFSVGNMEMVIGAVRAAEELDTPIILQIAQVRLKHSPLHLMGPLMLQAAEKAQVRIAVHLDHGLTPDTVKQALDLNFTSVMFDGSRFDDERNVEATAEVVRMSRNAGADVEAELGVVGGSEDNSTNEKIICTDPDRAKAFAEKTKVDALAVSIGNAHGHYAGIPKLRFDVLEEIHKRVQIPLVLHGGSGISAADFRKGVNLGIRKINIATANFDSVTLASERYLRTGGKHNYFELNEAMVRGMYDSVRKHILIFNNRMPLNEIE
ncbi:putative fructose-bisphosphate aldolase [Caprobacter fermentans]|uniref:Class II aldolase n=1 Tax=Caproicibacter fermentans TaxID=2576756 RepID=A0A6N8HWW3_9FIRM|nr:class II fructose-bisphosphate aldolase [Caproicibacter fermentans]MVB10169.1 putative fructose-bisphosphate aldolase [Caproicibacter fermentans]OCN00816.1 fructose-bisphosphate aldolase [Clostridium sp. W14A]QNK41760.1 class II aldolase [Caproicibacter fermentans]